MHQVNIDKSFCKGCMICLNACPKNVIETTDIRSEAGHLVPQAINLIDCTACRLCEIMCPDTCIEVIKDGGK